MFHGVNFTFFQGLVAVDLVVPMTVPTVASPSVLSLASTCTCSPTQVKSLMYVGFVANDSVRKETWGRIWLPMLDFRWIRNDWMNYWSMSWGIESSYTPMRKTNNLARKEPLGHLWFPMLDFHWILDDWMNYWSMSWGIESSYTPMRKNKQFSQKGNIRSHDYPCWIFIGWNIGSVPCEMRFWKLLLYKLFPCGRYRPLNSVLYPNNHILKSSEIIFNKLVWKDFSSKLNRDSFIRSILS